ncbi:MAG: amidase [Pseudomonadota bacterium]
MSISDQFSAYDGLGLADLVRRRQATPLELLEEAISRCEQVNSRLNAVIRPMHDEARAQISTGLPDGPFAGVPFLLKDLQANYAGLPTTSGHSRLQLFPAMADSELVKRHKQAGLVIFGKTNIPEFGLPPTTEPRLFGPTRNPWDLGRSAGGSSGGSAAAVAARIVPMAHGNDGGGSIRIPASCCGVFGLKPTRARNPLGPDFGDLMNGLVVEHALTLSVRDSAALLDATSGPDVGDPYFAPSKARSFLEEVGADPGRLRIAFSAKAADQGPVSPDAVRAMEEAAALCSELGHELIEAAPAINSEAMIQAFSRLWAVGAALYMDGLDMVLGPAQPGEVEPLTMALCEVGRGVSATQYLMTIIELQGMARQVARFFQDYDLFLTPTLAEPPVKLGELSAAADPMKNWERIVRYAPFAAVYNATGQPAMSVPLFWNEENLPLGAHFVGRFGDEATLFRLAAQLEQARPWKNRRPPVCAR